MRQKIKKYSQYLFDNDKIRFTIEMHNSMWCEDFKNYETKDLFSDGKLYLDPDLLDASDDVKRKIRGGYYNCFPFPPEYYRNKGLGGYVYVSDTPDGMRIFHEEPVKESVRGYSDYTGDRYTL